MIFTCDFVNLENHWQIASLVTQISLFMHYFLSILPSTHRRQLIAHPQGWDMGISVMTLQWRHNEGDSISNHQPHDCFLNRLFRHRSKKTSKLRVTGLCVGNSPEAGEFPAQMASNTENVSIWWRHHEFKLWFMFSFPHCCAVCNIFFYIAPCNNRTWLH